MAVYKATYCEPFSSTLDPRVTLKRGEETRAQYIKCKVDTSNSQITGYKIRLLDSDNNVVFPIYDTDKISPLTDLASLEDLYTGINTGLNGTYLEIPFFQNYAKPLLTEEVGGVSSSLKSYNAIYYKGYCAASVCLDPSTDTSWTWDSTNNRWTHPNTVDNPALIDGEPLAGGQLVVVKGSTYYPHGHGLLQAHIVKESDPDNDYVYLTLSYDFPHISAGKKIVVLQGKTYHNHVFNVVVATAHPTKGKAATAVADATSANPNMWCDCKGRDIPNFNVSGNNYKWEITLYQGNYSFSTETGQTHLHYADYTSISTEYYDMKLTSGKILGSTPKRIQISDLDEEEVPSSTSAETLVLQTRYIQFINNLQSGNESGNRVYVQTYDATYGHVYPIEDSLDSYAVENAQGARFYKHSNNPEAILESDIVDFGFGDIGGNHTMVFATDEGSASERKIFTPTSESSYWPTLGRLIEDYNIQAGDTILLTNVYNDYSDHSYPERNGVYKLLSNTPVEISGYGNCYLLARATSYSDWASYIGKVIYCAAGSLKGSNIESLASAGKTLWNPKSTTSGDSALYFSNERPILLFSDKLSHTFNFYYNVPWGSAQSATFQVDVVDGVQVENGDMLLFNNKKYGEASNVDHTSHTMTVTYKGEVTNGKYVYINQGENYGQKTFLISGSGSVDPNNPNLDLYTAKVLHNTADHTYISPYTGLQAGMKLKLTNNKTASFTDNTTSAWIDIVGFNDKLWRIDHPASKKLVNPLLSYDNSDKDVPWSYEVRSFFKVSDENPFACYEAPYANIKINDKLYGSFDEQDEPLTTMSLSSYEAMVRNLTALDSFYGRFIKISGTYNQFQQASWESYRWILLDRQGEILQDTGKQYTREIEVEFYGLSNDREESQTYYAVLYIEDTLNNVLQYTIKLQIEPSPSLGNELLVPFTAEYECISHSVVLNFQDQGLVKPSYNRAAISELLPAQERSYTEEDNISGLWDGGIKYTASVNGEDTGWMEITGLNKQDAVPVNVVPDSDHNYHTSNTLGNESYTAARSTKLGVNYSGYFNKGQSEIEQGTTTHEVTDRELVSSAEANGEFSFTTKFILDDNFCGECLAVNVESEYDENHANIIIDQDGGQRGLEGYLSFAVFLPDNVNEGTINSDRHKIAFRLYKDRFTGTQTFKTKNFTANVSGVGTEYQFSTANTNYFYLQYADVSSVTNTSDFLHLSLTHDMWIYFVGDATNYSQNHYYTSIKKYLGNCCIVRPGDDIQYVTAQTGENFDYTNASRLVSAPIYWDEERMGYVKTYSTDINKFVHKTGDAITYVDTAITGGPAWPDATAEASAYWYENNISQDLPINWGSITGEGLEELTPIKRHPGKLSSTQYRVDFNISNIKAIYSSWSDIILTHLPPDSGQESRCYGTVRLYKCSGNEFIELGCTYIINNSQ